MNLCRVSIDEIAHDLSSSKYHAAIRQKAEEMLKGVFNPLSKDNIANFFSSDLNEKDLGALFHIPNAIQTENHEYVGRIVEAALYGFYRRLAYIEAQDQINNADCGHCFDAGCHNCIEQEVE